MIGHTRSNEVMNMFGQSNLSNKWDSYSEEELWAEYSNDNREAYSTLFLRCYERLFRYGIQFASSEEVVKDSIQKLFLRLWRRREELACPESVYGYLYVSLRRILLRRDKRCKARDQRNTNFMEEGACYISSVEKIIISQEEKEQRSKLL